MYKVVQFVPARGCRHAPGTLDRVERRCGKKAAKAARDSEVEAFDARTLPTLQLHLQRARSTDESWKDAR